MTANETQLAARARPAGHLYERMLKVMVQGVLAHSTAPVKFWFLQNYASPQFVAFMPHMAARLGFEVGFVTYQWPGWLRRQSVKQRIIWGYKILFLDVRMRPHPRRCRLCVLPTRASRLTRRAPAGTAPL
jgi:hypothetical protein